MNGTDQDFNASTELFQLFKAVGLPIRGPYFDSEISEDRNFGLGGRTRSDGDCKVLFAEKGVSEVVIRE